MNKISYFDKKQSVIKLRKQGLTYEEIRNQVQVAKSTLSIWLQSAGLAQKQNQHITKKRILTQQKGAQTRKKIRLLSTNKIVNNAKNEIKDISLKELWLIGIALYWAEGAKQKPHNISARVSFCNSDPRMIRLFIKWLDIICSVSIENCLIDLYIHKNSQIDEARKYWSNELCISEDKIQLRLKKQKLNTKRKNIGKNYNGLIRIVVRRSTNLNRRISGWIERISEYGEWCSGNTSVFGTEDPRFDP